MNSLTKNLILWLVVAMVLMAVFNNFAPREGASSREVDYSTFLAEVKAGHVTEVIIEGRTIQGTTQGGDAFVTYSPGDPDLVTDLLNNGVAIKANGVVITVGYASG